MLLKKPEGEDGLSVPRGCANVFILLLMAVVFFGALYGISVLINNLGEPRIEYQNPEQENLQ